VTVGDTAPVLRLVTDNYLKRTARFGTLRTKDFSKVMGDLDELARQWQQEDAYLRPKPGGVKARA
jgi:hypothetical protein